MAIETIRYCYNTTVGPQDCKYAGGVLTTLCPKMELCDCALQFYLVHISVCAASYPLDQLEILLWIPPGQVDTGVHHFHCRLRRRSRTVYEPQQCTKTDI